MIRINGKDYNSTINQVPTNEIGTYHLANNPNIYEPQRTNNFEFVIPDLNASMKKAGMTSTDTDSSSNIVGGGDVIRIALSKGFIPSFTQNPIEVKRGNTTIKYAGTPTYGSGTLDLNDYIGANVFEVLAAWQNLSYNVATEKIGLASDYKKQAWICEYSPDYQLVRKWKLYGCWVSGLTSDDLTNERNEVVKIHATIQYDRSQIDYSDQ